MRLVGTLETEDDAKKACRYLKSQGIEGSSDAKFESQTGHIFYEIWVHDEDLLDRAAAILEEYRKNPSDAKYQIPDPEPTPLPRSGEEASSEERPHRFKTHVTFFFMALCVLIFFFTTLQRTDLGVKGGKDLIYLTPIQSELMYDLPPGFEKLSLLLKPYRGKEAPPAVLLEAKQMAKEPYWKGFYSLLIAKIKKVSSSSGEGPLFIKIRQGEVWRLISPIFLHQDLLHILFNMLWLWYLGRPVEARIGPFRTLFFTLIAALGSNTFQYLMSGPFFIGYSGVITGLAGFIWMREKVAPWEGYPLSKGTLLFLLFFIFAVLAIQASSFVTQIFTSYDFTPNIANTAHISGGLIGMWLGRFKFFAQRVHQ